jgi:hypothetical protein
VVRRKRLHPRDHRRVIERVGKTVAGECRRRRRLDLQVEQQRLLQSLLPIVDADSRLDLEIGDEDRVHFSDGVAVC